MTEERNCCSLPLYDNPSVCDSCHDVDGITIIKGKKGTGMGIFSAWMTAKLGQYFGKGRVYPRWLDGVALNYLVYQIESDNWLRASGDCECPVCHRLYREHPAWEEVGTFVLICDGSVFKL